MQIPSAYVRLHLKILFLLLKRKVIIVILCLGTTVSQNNALHNYSTTA